MEGNKINRLTFPQQLALRERMDAFVSEGIIMIVDGGCQMMPGWSMLRATDVINSEEPGLDFPVTVANVTRMRDDLYGPIVPRPAAAKNTTASRIAQLEQSLADLQEIVERLV